MPPATGAHATPSSAPASPPAGFPSTPPHSTGGHDYGDAGEGHGQAHSPTSAESAAEFGAGGFERTMLVHPPNPADPVPASPTTEPGRGLGAQPGGDDNLSTRAFTQSAGGPESSIAPDLGQRPGEPGGGSAPDGWSERHDLGRHADRPPADLEQTITQDLATPRPGSGQRDGGYGPQVAPGAFSRPAGEATTENLQMPRPGHESPAQGYVQHPQRPDQGYARQSQPVDRGYSPVAPQDYGHQVPRGEQGQSGGYAAQVPGQQAQHAPHAQPGQQGQLGQPGHSGPHPQMGQYPQHGAQQPQGAPPHHPGQGYGQPARGVQGEAAFGGDPADGYQGYPGYRNAGEDYGEEKSSTGKVLFAVGGGLAILAVVLVVFFYVMA
jgi:hypothetical protein